MHPHMQHYLFMHLWTHFRSAHVLHPYTEVFFLVPLHLCLHSACRVSTWFPDCGKLQSEQCKVTQIPWITLLTLHAYMLGHS